MGHGGAAERRAKKKAKREARRREEAERACREAAEWAWWYEGLEGTPTEEIVAKLGSLGIQADLATFRALAGAHGTVDGIAEEWGAKSTATGLWKDYLWIAARALWPRWTPDLFSMDVLAKEHFSGEGVFDPDLENPEERLRLWRRARAVMDLVAPREGPPRPDLMEEVSDHVEMDVDVWLAELPFTLADVGMVDEALEIGARMAAVRDANLYLAGRAVILAKAGRREEALRQLEMNLAQLPDDPWIRLKAGDAYKALGDLGSAEAMYRRTMVMTDAGGRIAARGDAVLKLADVLHEVGRCDEADALIGAEKDAVPSWIIQHEEPGGEAFEDEDEFAGDDEEEEDSLPVAPHDPLILTPPGTVRRTAPKLGRNDPCPCGSGKKYKRCCGA
jgi:tetratricopeptide (TPR) repeat protein